MKHRDAKRARVKSCKNLMDTSAKLSFVMTRSVLLRIFGNFHTSFANTSLSSLSLPLSLSEKSGNYVSVRCVFQLILVTGFPSLRSKPRYVPNEARPLVRLDNSTCEQTRSRNVRMTFYNIYFMPYVCLNLCVERT